jgi:hypothetical protein
MPRNISFAFTTEQIKARTKTVTRRDGWTFLKAGEVLCAVEKSQGLGKGGKVKRLGMIRVVSVRREPLSALLADTAYGYAECAKEGFPDRTPTVFMEFFCKSHKGVTRDSIITRIEFEYIDAAQSQRAA